MPPQKLLTSLQKALSVSEAAIKRLIGSTQVSTESKSPEETTRSYDIGLRVVSLDKESSLPHINESSIVQICQDYAATCPLVFRWICRGDFNPKKIPSDLTHAKILHACRTAGRLRAKLLKGR